MSSAPGRRGRRQSSQQAAHRRSGRGPEDGPQDEAVEDSTRAVPSPARAPKGKPGRRRGCWWEDDRGQERAQEASISVQVWLLPMISRMPRDEGAAQGWGRTAPPGSPQAGTRSRKEGGRRRSPKPTRPGEAGVKKAPRQAPGGGRGAVRRMWARAVRALRVAVSSLGEVPWATARSEPPAVARPRRPDRRAHAAQAVALTTGEGVLQAQPLAACNELGIDKLI